MTKITLRSLNQKSEFMHSALPSTIPSPLILKFNSHVEEDPNGSGDLSNARDEAEVSAFVFLSNLNGQRFVSQRFSLLTRKAANDQGGASVMRSSDAEAGECTQDFLCVRPSNLSYMALHSPRPILLSSRRSPCRSTGPQSASRETRTEMVCQI